MYASLGRERERERERFRAILTWAQAFRPQSLKNDIYGSHLKKNPNLRSDIFDSCVQTPTFRKTFLCRFISKPVFLIFYSSFISGAQTVLGKRKSPPGGFLAITRDDRH